MHSTCSAAEREPHTHAKLVLLCPVPWGQLPELFSQLQALAQILRRHEIDSHLHARLQCTGRQAGRQAVSNMAITSCWSGTHDARTSISSRQPTCRFLTWCGQPAGTITASPLRCSILQGSTPAARATRHQSTAGLEAPQKTQKTQAQRSLGSQPEDQQMAEFHDQAQRWLQRQETGRRPPLQIPAAEWLTAFGLQSPLVMF